MEIIRIRLTDLEQNKGQVAGLPSNPRQWGRGELDNLVKSIQETPELLEARMAASTSSSAVICASVRCAR